MLRVPLFHEGEEAVEGIQGARDFAFGPGSEQSGLAADDAAGESADDGEPLLPEADRLAASIGRVGRPLEVAAPFELVEQAGHRLARDAKGAGEERGLGRIGILPDKREHLRLNARQGRCAEEVHVGQCGPFREHRPALGGLLDPARGRIASPDAELLQFHVRSSGK